MGALTYPNTFTNGQTTDADKMMADYDAAKDVVNGNIEAVNLKDGGLANASFADDAVETAKIKDANITYEKLADELKHILPPVGTIVPIHPDVKTAYLPDSTYWALCDGATLLPTGYFNTGNDSYVPDLTDERLLAGSTAYGIGGDNDSFAHTHDFTQPDAHVVTQGTFNGPQHKHKTAWTNANGDFYLLPSTKITDYGLYPVRDTFTVNTFVNHCGATNFYSLNTTPGCTKTQDATLSAHSGGAAGAVVEDRTDKNLPLYFKTKFYMRIA